MAFVARNWHLERYPGKHVAIDMTTDEVVLVADTPRELHELIQAQGLRNVATMRAPTEDEPLFAGLAEPEWPGRSHGSTPTRPSPTCGVVGRSSVLSRR